MDRAGGGDDECGGLWGCRDESRGHHDRLVLAASLLGGVSQRQGEGRGGRAGGRRRGRWAAGAPRRGPWPPRPPASWRRRFFAALRSGKERDRTRAAKDNDEGGGPRGGRDKGRDHRGRLRPGGVAVWRHFAAAR